MKLLYTLGGIFVAIFVITIITLTVFITSNKNSQNASATTTVGDTVSFETISSGSQTLYPGKLYRIQTPKNHRVNWKNTKEIFIRTCPTCSDVSNLPGSMLKMGRSKSHRSLYFSTKEVQNVIFTTVKY